MIRVSNYCRKDCPDRSVSPNCHTYCELYLKGKALGEAIRQKHQEELIIDHVLNESASRRIKKRRSIKL